MTAASDAPRRVLVAWCPAWPEPSLDAGQAWDAERARDAGLAAEAGPDARAFEQVVAVVEGFCPRVEVLYPGACAVGARGFGRAGLGQAVSADEFAPVEARRAYAHQQLSRLGLGAPDLAQLELGLVLGRLQEVGFHGSEV